MNPKHPDRSTESDESIYSRFLEKRQEEDMTLLLQRHREGLFLFINGFVHNPEDAEEIMLDTFAQIAIGKSLFAGRSSFKTWLYSIAKKKAFMHLRKKRFDLQPLELLQLPAESLPELELLTKERDRQLYQAMEQLKEEYRQILFLIYFEKMSMEEAARVMGRSKKQVYHLSERGRKALKAQLERMGFEG